MATVVTTSASVDQFTGGLESFEVAAATVRELIFELDRRFPGLGTHVDERMNIAIDGQIYVDAWAQPIRADSEVFLIPKIGGG